MVLLQLSHIPANYCCPQQARATSLSQSALLQLPPHPCVFCLFCFFGQENSSRKRHVQEKKKKEHTVSPYPIRSLVQIAPLLTNESLEGCTQQSLSSGAITASVSSKELGGTITITEGLLPAWIALDIRKPAVY